MEVAAVIATTPCPIFAIKDEDNPVAIAVCSLDLPGYARRLRFAWTDPACRKMGFGLPSLAMLFRALSMSGSRFDTKVKSELPNGLVSSIGDVLTADGLARPRKQHSACRLLIRTRRGKRLPMLCGPLGWRAEHDRSSLYF
ncbi:hypothetical protein HED51_11330 [Ochrobactrum grignonense]|nr:hypothetical protein [Brucella grignonensis]